MYRKGFPGGSAGKESARNAGDQGSIPGLGRFPWRRERLPTPVSWPGEFQRVGHNLVTFTFTFSCAENKLKMDQCLEHKS